MMPCHSFLKQRRRAVNKNVLLITLASICSLATADDQKTESPNQSTFAPGTAVAEPIERIIKEGRTCYRETITEKMVEACLEGRTYYTPVTEKSRVQIKCPPKGSNKSR